MNIYIYGKYKGKENCDAAFKTLMSNFIVYPSEGGVVAKPKKTGKTVAKPKIKK